MKKLLILVLYPAMAVFGQEGDSLAVYKKRVLESVEVDLLSSYYKQDGIHSAVGGGVGTEKLTDVTADIIIAIPLNDDDVLTFDAGISAYTSASSGNINPFFTDGTYTNSTGNNNSGASGRYSDPTLRKKDDDEEYPTAVATPAPYGSPWIASTGASRKDMLTALSTSYSHSSDDRNTIWSANASGSIEYDYHSIGFGAGLAKLFNEKNTEVSVKVNAYLDKWKPIYPTELHEYGIHGFGFLDKGYFEGVTIYNQNGEESRNYMPSAFKEFESKNRNSYSLSLTFSQILTDRMQASLFMDVLYQEGLLSTPYHRIYFADKANYYIGQARYIPVYSSTDNRGIFRLADDVERLPDTRFKLPIGARLNYYVNDVMVVRTYYRFYADDWGLQSHTASVEIPIKLGSSFKVYPMYRFYTQVASKYFAPQESHYSFQKYYTSDYDLSSFDSHQYGFGLTYTDIFQKFRIGTLGLKTIDFRYNHYERSDSLNADIFSIALKFAH